MAKGRKLAIFDFCGTIFRYQSPDMYADFTAPDVLRTRFLQFVCSKIEHSYKYNGKKQYHKQLKLQKIKGIPLEQLTARAKEFVQQVILNDLVPDVVTELDKYLADPSYDVVIASAGYNLYLQEFCRLKNIPLMVATNIEIKNNVATGRIDGIDCFGQNKILKLKEIIDLESYDLESSICFSDSMTDKPIFDLAGTKIFVKRADDGYTLTKI